MIRSCDYHKHSVERPPGTRTHAQHTALAAAAHVSPIRTCMCACSGLLKNDTSCVRQRRHSMRVDQLAASCVCARGVAGVAKSTSEVCVGSGLVGCWGLVVGTVPNERRETRGRGLGLGVGYRVCATDKLGTCPRGMGAAGTIARCCGPTMGNPSFPPYCTALIPSTRSSTPHPGHALLTPRPRSPPRSFALSVRFSLGWCLRPPSPPVPLL